MVPNAEEQANDMLRILLTNVRNTSNTLGEQHPSTLSARETVRNWLLAMREKGYVTSLSRTLQSNSAGTGMDSASQQGNDMGNERMDVDAAASIGGSAQANAAKDDVDELIDAMVRELVVR